jgi:uncharacterized protein
MRALQSLPVRHEQVRFFADGLRLDGELWVPESTSRVPGVVVCSGYQGLKSIHPARFARAFAAAGVAVLGFDYRGFGWSEGERGRLSPADQIEDARAAISVLEGDARILPDRLGLLGWALGGGIAIAETAEDPRVGAVAAINAVADGLVTTRRTHTDESWAALEGLIARDRVARARHGRSDLVAAFEALRLGSGTTAEYVDDHLRPVPGFGTDVTLESVERLTRFRPESLAKQIAPRPLLLLHGTKNDLYDYDESVRLFEAARDPKLLVPLREAGHTEWMHDGHPRFRAVVAVLRRFFTDHALPDQVPQV